MAYGLDERKIKDQTEFCMKLMKKLSDEIKNADFEYIKANRLQNDIVRLRRELNYLREYLYRY